MLQGLKSIDLSFNYLETIPEAITRLPMLNTLVLVGNNIATLPASIINLKNLQNLKMASNNVSKTIFNLKQKTNVVKFCEKFGITKEELDNTKEATANMAYTRYVLEQGMSGDVLDLRVAMLPCIAGYGEIAKEIMKGCKNIGKKISKIST